MLEAGVLAGADVVLDLGVGSVAGFEEGELFARGVGGGEAVALSVGLFEQAQLGAGAGSFAAADDPHVGRPVGGFVAPERGA